nr:MAG TPA: hypothetical protein [Caudoviricetes sp.]
MCGEYTLKQEQQGVRARLTPFLLFKKLTYAIILLSQV